MKPSVIAPDDADTPSAAVDVNLTGAPAPVAARDVQDSSSGEGTADNKGGGDEGNEGNEGDEGNEGREGNEGNEGNEGDEGDEGNEGNEGDEGNEGNEGNEGRG